MARNSSGCKRLLSIIFARVFLVSMVTISLSAWLLIACAKQEEQAQGVKDVPAASPPVPLRATVGGKEPVDLTTAVVRVAQQNIPAVVHIEVTQRQEVENPLLPFENAPFFQYFFGPQEMPRKFRRELKGLGTGMIMDSQGHILTNYHVVGGATEIRVLLSNGKQYPAKVIGSDPKTDLAVIRFSAKESLPQVTFGDSQEEICSG